jgi:hypothetical protein
MSPAHSIAVPPACRISAAAFSSGSGRRPVSATFGAFSPEHERDGPAETGARAGYDGYLCP